MIDKTNIAGCNIPTLIEILNMVKLQDHQSFVLDYFLEHPHQRGLLVVHGTGSGKTLTAVSIAERLRYFKEVIVLAPKSLHDNFKKDLDKVIRGDQERAARYRYISSNASNMIDKLENDKDEITGMDIKSLDLNKKLVICDEFHNLLVAMSNGSKNASALYDMMMRSKNSKFVFLTATPIVNSYYEIIIALNLCNGYLQGDDRAKLTLFPEDEATFNKYFLNEETRTLKNTDKLRNRMFGLVSYYGDLYNHKLDDFYTDMKKTIKMEHFPDRLPIKVELVKMSDVQYTEYLMAREKERLETKRSIGGGKWGKMSYKDLKNIKTKINPNGSIGGVQLDDVSGGAITSSKQFGKSTSYRIKSRQISNIYFPDDDQINVYSNIAAYSPKIKKLYENMDKTNKVIVYSNFVKAGIRAVSSYLDTEGYKEWMPGTKPDDSKYYAFYTGEVKPEDRTKILKEFNRLESPIKVLLISSSGAEGLSARNVRQVHILEPYWNTERLRQVMYRGIRFHSHDELPEKERNVQVYIYLSVYPATEKAMKEMPTDVHLFKEAAKKYELNKQMLEVVASVAIDCQQSNKGINFECYKCAPSADRRLFINDLAVDMLTPSPCTSAKTINAKEVIVNGVQYYVDDNNVVYHRIENSDTFEVVSDPDVIELILSI